MNMIVIAGFLLGLSPVLKGQDNAQMKMGMHQESRVEKAVCVLYPTAGNKVSGTVTFSRVADGVKVVADLDGLTKGLHGIHIHEYGDCSASDGSSAGGHYNPEMKNHSGPMDMNRHEGDMGNIEADADGKAHLDYTDHTILLDGPHSVIGHSVVVHRDADDLKTQPSGNSGPRVACGVIGTAK